MSPPKQLIELVERFDRNKESYISGQYNETQVRREFVDPFFALMGWDIENKQGFAEAYKDVIHEDAIKVGTETKAPDYCFQIGGTRKFFVEAKRPSVNLKEDFNPAFQLRRYAWSAKLPLSILTDFEEFVVYDTRIKPSQTDKPSIGRIIYLTYQEYADKWEQLVNTFSKDAILKGSFDKYAETNKGKKGTTEVDAAFLEEIELWRKLLAQNLALRNPKLTQRELNFSVQRTLDRIIFLRICEDRGIEPYGKLQDIIKRENVYPVRDAVSNGVYSELCKYFQRADERYNSGLFYFSNEKKRTEPPDNLTLHLKIEDKLLKDIIKKLYYPEPYAFSVIPADILGQIYEQFLGKVIHLTDGHRAVVEDKPEVKKAGGVYYTPTYIVDYIVKNTVGKLLDGNTPKQISKIRILDPACGSGSFLLGAYQYLLDWHLKYYMDNNPAKSSAVHQTATGGWRLTTQERKRILLNNIYGVDIDTQAVEVTKLSLLLKVLEGESELRLFHNERALPDLGKNIKCGNSLIGPDFYNDQQLLLIDEEEKYRINVFDWNTEFPDIIKSGGFDAVIGNPPYGATLNEDSTDYLNSKFKLQDYQLDTYMLFIEKSTSLIKKSGLLGMIIPNTWLLNLQSNHIREFLFNNVKIEEIVHYRHPVFTNATVDTEILIFKKETLENTSQINITIVEKTGNKVGYNVSQRRWQTNKGKPVNIFEKPEFVSLSDKLKQFEILDNVCVITQGCKPFQVGKGKPKQTRKIVNEKPFVSEKKEDSTFRPLLRGSLIQKYTVLWNRDSWISFGDWLAEPRYSANFDASEKIVIRQTGDSLIATLDNKQFIVRDNLYTIVQRQDNINLRYILGLMNSRLLNWFYQNVLNPEKGEALAQVKRGHLAELPISYDKSKRDRMVKLVDRMLELHQQFPKAKTPHDKESLQRQITTTDNQIDQLVYQLYDLTEEEINIVKNVG